MPLSLPRAPGARRVTGFGPSEDWEPGPDTYSVRRSLCILGLTVAIGLGVATLLWMFGF